MTPRSGGLRRRRRARRSCRTGAARSRPGHKGAVDHRLTHTRRRRRDPWRSSGRRRRSGTPRPGCAHTVRVPRPGDRNPRTSSSRAAAAGWPRRRPRRPRSRRRPGGLEPDDVPLGDGRLPGRPAAAAGTEQPGLYRAQVDEQDRKVRPPRRGGRRPAPGRQASRCAPRDAPARLGAGDLRAPVRCRLFQEEAAGAEGGAGQQRRARDEERLPATGAGPAERRSRRAGAGPSSSVAPPVSGSGTGAAGRRTRRRRSVARARRSRRRRRRP